MGAYLESGGLTTWYDEQGVGEPLVLLHGGLNTNANWAEQMSDFSAQFRVIAPERRGHGHTADIEGPLSYDAMAADTIAFLMALGGGPAHLLGWSDGGIVGLLAAMARPDLIRKLVVIGTNYDTTGVVPEAMEGFASLQADGDELAILRTPYEAVSPDGPEHWPVVVAKFKEMVTTQPTISVEQLGGITAHTLVVVGDDDIVALDHTASLFRAIPNSELAVIPGTSHFGFMEKPELVNRLVLDFLQREPATTFWPLRRAAAGDDHES